MPAELLRQERLTWPHFKLYDTCRGLQEGKQTASQQHPQQGWFGSHRICRKCSLAWPSV